jgi:hypothetical protein
MIGESASNAVARDTAATTGAVVAATEVAVEGTVAAERRSTGGESAERVVNVAPVVESHWEARAQNQA